MRVRVLRVRRGSEVKFYVQSTRFGFFWRTRRLYTAGPKMIYSVLECATMKADEVSWDHIQLARERRERLKRWFTRNDSKTVVWERP